MVNKKFTSKDLVHIFRQTTSESVPKTYPPFNLRELVHSIEYYPFFNRMYRASYRAIRAILVLEYTGKIVSIYYYVDHFFTEHELDEMNDLKWDGIITRVSLTTYEFQQMFPESNPIRYCTKPMCYIYLHTLWSDVNAKYTVTKKVKQEFPMWINKFFSHLPKTFFNKLESEKQFQRNREMFMTAFEGNFPLPIKDERRWFNPKERKQSAERAGFKCQSKNSDGQICDKPLVLEEGEVDHEKPYSQGGRTDLNNARWICPARNKGKGTKCSFT